jgi:hypothetical protein
MATLREPHESYYTYGPARAGRRAVLFTPRAPHTGSSGSGSRTSRHEAPEAAHPIATARARIHRGPLPRSSHDGTLAAPASQTNADALAHVGRDEVVLADLDAVAEHVSGSRRPVLPPELRHLMPDDHGEHASA